jgi:predicted phosphodiesterase
VRIAIFSDVHGNYAALCAVLERIDALDVDRVFCLGDLVGRGPEPERVVRAIRSRGIPILRGNWDEWVSGTEGWSAGPKKKRWIEAGRRLMSRRSRAFLARSPSRRRVLAGEASLFLAHGSPRDPVELLVPEMSDERLAEAIASADAEVIAVGHSHRPFIRRIGSKLLINVGTAGYAFDHDPRPSFALIELDGGVRAELVRVDYPLARNLRALRRLRRKGIVDRENELRYRVALLGDSSSVDRRTPDQWGDEALVRLLLPPAREVHQGAQADLAAVRRLKAALSIAAPFLPRRALERALRRTERLERALASIALTQDVRFELAGLSIPGSERLLLALDRRAQRLSRELAAHRSRPRRVAHGLAIVALSMRASPDAPQQIREAMKAARRAPSSRKEDAGHERALRELAGEPVPPELDLRVGQERRLEARASLIELLRTPRAERLLGSSALSELRRTIDAQSDR